MSAAKKRVAPPMCKASFSGQNGIANSLRPVGGIVQRTTFIPGVSRLTRQNPLLRISSPGLRIPVDAFIPTTSDSQMGSSAPFFSGISRVFDAQKDSPAPSNNHNFEKSHSPHSQVSKK